MARILMLPGFACQGWIWDDVCRSLEGDYEITVVDWPDRMTAGFAILNDFAGWLAAEYPYELSSCRAMIGHSMGGLISLLMASSGRTAAQKVILVESYLAAPSPFFRNIVAPSCPEEIRLRLQRMLNEELPHFSEALRAELRTANHEALLRKVVIPVAAVYGDRGPADRDAVIENLDWPDWIRAMVQVEMVRNAGHFPMVENSDETASILRRLLAKY
ncbi:MAG: alpha/beta hydrolase [candidate division Zixibacteria bacterium]|nr:alpha/beta hydrolase [candidate division Zixibacteria bacterium]